VTQRTRDLLGERYRFQERGQIEVKGKGRMTTYLLSGRAHQRHLRQGRVDTGGDDQPQRRGGAPEQMLHRVEDLRRGDRVEVVEDEDDRLP
jgi:hypothetical protein